MVSAFSVNQLRSARFNGTQSMQPALHFLRFCFQHGTLMLTYLLNMYVQVPFLSLIPKQYSVVTIYTAFTFHKYEESFSDHLESEG